MAVADLQVIGFAQNLPRRIAASSTRFEVGEPLYLDGATYTTGASDQNVAQLMDADGIVIGTDTFCGIAIKGALPFESGTLVAQTTMTANPISFLGRIEGRALVVGNIDTAAELLAIINDAVLIDYDATGAADGGELYTIHDDAAADTSAFTIVEGNIATGRLQVTMDGRAYRLANTIA